MAAEFDVISPGNIWTPEPVQRLWFFPEGSIHLRYSAHWHLWWEGGIRQNIPLLWWGNPTFVVVKQGKFSLKDYFGSTLLKVDVRDQIWHDRTNLNRISRTYQIAIFGGLRQTRARNSRRNLVTGRR
jgi:hypothetical protein